MANCTVTMLRNPAASFKCPLYEGETGDIDQSLAEQLVKLKVAEIVAMPKSIKAVPDEPAIKAADPVAEPTAEPIEDKADRPKKPGK